MRRRSKKIIKTNPNLIELINKLNKQSKSEDAAIWKDVASRLSRSNRRTAEVNLSNINRHAEADETILVPGKVLSNGELDKKVNVVALKFSAKAQEKIESAGGECISIDEIIETNPKGSNIRIIE
ncbi:50S ribosomal protein L18e [uncultured Methanobrevibacter sp.]|uniref:50S ribosomal protein L18e n=1 Tax=uncultured Methanobrevibacter sp. TaxID=253161 RepID=UPI0025EE2042|nr:50S ribosomal protein L18e [uncultured Methanobrevibacter sp.]